MTTQIGTFQKFMKDPLKNALIITTEQLEKYLRKLSEIYYNESESAISDEDFDNLKEILAKRNPKSSFLLEIGAPVTKDMVDLPYPMASLDKIKADPHELTKWVKKYKGAYSMSDKLDGISALLYRSDDKLKLYSRGNGTVGQDITHLLKYINVFIDGNEKFMQQPEGTAIRGELIISRENFTTIANKMKNARNAVAGVVNGKKVDPSIASLVELVTYNVVYPIYKQEKQYQVLKSWNFNVVHHQLSNSLDTQQLIDYLILRRQKSKYEMDGIVIMDNSAEYTVTDENPKYGFAFKTILKEQIATTRVLKVDWNVSKNGYIKPRIFVDPVELVGVTIQRATAHNAKFIQDNNIGAGAVIKIIRSGDVIPKIIEVIKPAKKSDMPDFKYKWNDTGVDIIVDDIKKFKSEIAVKQIEFAMKTLGIKNISEKTIEKIVNEKYNSFTNIVQADLNDISEIIGSKMTDKIYSGTDGIYNMLKDADLPTLMTCSGYFGRGLGEKKLKLIVDTYPDILEYDDDTIYNKVLNLNGFQDVTTEKFVKGISKFKKFLEELKSYINVDKKKQKLTKGTLFDGEKIVMTGFRSDELTNLIESNGGTVSSGVSKNTTLVIYSGDTNSTKTQKAKSFGTKTISLEEFKNKYLK